MSIDIIDIMLAKKKAQGEAATIMASAREALSAATEAADQAAEASAAAQEANETANVAATTAAEAADDVAQMRNDVTAAAESLIDSKMEEEYLPAINESVETAVAQALEANAAVSEAVEAANAAKEAANKAVIDWRTSVTTHASKAYKDYTAQVKKVNGDVDAWVASRNYTATGQNEDGAMTQKAITKALSDLETKINNISNSGSSSGGGNNTIVIDLGSENENSIVIVDENGKIVASGVAIDDMVTALIRMGSLDIPNSVGLEIDYANKTFTRTQEARSRAQGADFDKYTMYGGRMRCNVADNGTITAFYGDANYKEDGSNGQVMVYQPKFYYSRVPKTLVSGTIGQIIRKEVITLSANKQPGFTIHPLFKTVNGEELDYVLLPAYEGCIYDASENTYDLSDGAAVDVAVDKLSSIAGAKPISGANKDFTAKIAEQLARNRGEGWHITNLAAESAAQFLESVEFGTLNAQSSLELGVVNLNINNATANCASTTGSTATLGNKTGAATVTPNTTNGATTNYSSAGTRAITYRGVENPWGNIWHIVGGINVYGSGAQSGGLPYVCTDFNYNTEEIGENYKELGFYLPTKSGYASGFGYNDPTYDWVFLPVENLGNSALPIGDQNWIKNKLNGINGTIAGGSWLSNEVAGPFAYGFDQDINISARTLSAKIMFIPTINDIYHANIAKWTEKMG